MKIRTITLRQLLMTDFKGNLDARELVRNHGTDNVKPYHPWRIWLHTGLATKDAAKNKAQTELAQNRRKVWDSYRLLVNASGMRPWSRVKDAKAVIVAITTTLGKYCLLERRAKKQYAGTPAAKEQSAIWGRKAWKLVQAAYAHGISLPATNEEGQGPEARMLAAAYKVADEIAQGWEETT